MYYLLRPRDIEFVNKSSTLLISNVSLSRRARPTRVALRSSFPIPLPHPPVSVGARAGQEDERGANRPDFSIGEERKREAEAGRGKAEPSYVPRRPAFPSFLVRAGIFLSAGAELVAATRGLRANRTPAGRAFPRYRAGARARAVPASSSLWTSDTQDRGSRSRTRSSTGGRCGTGGESSALDGGTIVAVTCGRGEARSEVGMAALDIRCPRLLLCQISDSRTYAATLSKLYVLDPAEVVMPDTMRERAAGGSVLCQQIEDKFAELPIVPISRVHFNDGLGLERIRSLCIAEYSSVELFVKQKYYALAAAAAVLKYAEYRERLVYAPKSIKVEFQGSPNATAIDLESARSLELVRSQCGQRNVSLLAAMDRCSTPMGRKLLRTSILQPPCNEAAILARQAAVAELVSDRSLRTLLQPIVRRLYGADRLLLLSTLPVDHGNTVQSAEQNLNYILLLKNLLDVVPELGRTLSAAESESLRGIRKGLEAEEFRLMRETILRTIHPDARSVSGYTSACMQRCFAIRAGINDLLDIARRTYCELIDDMKAMVENLAAKYRMNLSLSCTASLGYHIQAIALGRGPDGRSFEPPAEFVEVRKTGRSFTMTTCALATLSQQAKIACEELHLMSNVLLRDLLATIREHIGRLFHLSADVAELDLILSLAEVSSPRSYVRPTFGRKLEVLDSRHPVMEAFGLDGLVPNPVAASIGRNLSVITGPNMSGKSTYLKQIVLLHVMAQIGCFVPARAAAFRIADSVFCKIATRDDIEGAASTFTLEMKEAQYILRSVTPTSLVVLDELGKSTAVEEGASIAWAVCERLLATTAFVFAATHFSLLTKLPDLYCTATNLHFETSGRLEAADGEEPRGWTYTHRLRAGVYPDDDYGIGLAELSGLPASVTARARRYASERAVDRVRVAGEGESGTRACHDLVAELLDLLEAEEVDRERVLALLERLAELWRRDDGGDGSAKRSAVRSSGQAEPSPSPCTDARKGTEPAGTGTDAAASRVSSSSLSFYSAETRNASSISVAACSAVESSARSAAGRESCSTLPLECPTSPASVSTLERSISKLYEYYLSDVDFEPGCLSEISAATDAASSTASLGERGTR